MPAEPTNPVVAPQPREREPSGASSRPSLVHTMEIAAKIEDVWTAVTDPGFTEQYLFGLCVRSDWSPGARIVYEQGGETRIEGEVLEVVRPTRLRHTLRLLRNEDVAADLPSRVTWELEQRGATCVVTVVHDEFSEETATYQMVGSGWPLILEGLRVLLETGSSESVQSRWPDFVVRPTSR